MGRLLSGGARYIPDGDRYPRLLLACGVNGEGDLDGVPELRAVVVKVETLLIRESEDRRLSEGPCSSHEDASSSMATGMPGEGGGVGIW